MAETFFSLLEISPGAFKFQALFSGNVPATFPARLKREGEAQDVQLVEMVNQPTTTSSTDLFNEMWKA